MYTKEQINKIKAEARKSDGRLPLIFEALGDQGRFRIFNLIIKYHDLCVTDISEILDITVPAVSQQLKILERVGVVERMKMGQMVCYEIKDDPMTKYIVGLLKVESQSAFSKLLNLIK